MIVLSMGVDLGAAVSAGTVDSAPWVSAAPAAAADVTWHFSWTEAWVGASTTALRWPGSDGNDLYDPLELNAGIGFGARTFSAGFYMGYGLPGWLDGAYARLSFPGPGVAQRVGGEARAFATRERGSAGILLMARVELGPEPKRPPPRPPPRMSPEPPPEPAPEPAPEPTPEEPPPEHHDDPYGSEPPP